MAVKINSVSGVPYDYYSNLSPSPLLIVIFIICIVIYFLLFRSLGTNSASISNIMGSASSSSSISSSSSSSGSMRILEILAWGVFVLLVLLNGASYFFNIDITASLKNLFLCPKNRFFMYLIMYTITKIQEPSVARMAAV